ncbi:conserved hypothetical protein [uncultured delta proteobacterium]|uniref:Regulator of ribonuclease activity homolog n=1 Tax=uncultured delta proteobacterium TaxID=34034 RepID=A0A212KF26_9DELT|nr:conserved hypothetical protein [uncultured delta proteobacterium]
MNILSQSQLAELQQFDGPTVCNALEAFNCRPKNTGFMKPGMLPQIPLDKPMIGYAATAKVSSMSPGRPENAELLMGYYESVLNMADPTISVIQDTDPEPCGSFWGEVQATLHKTMGVVGTICTSGVRDIKEVAELGFGFFSNELRISHGYIHVENYNCPVNVCGLTVTPGDLLFADRHGVVCIPHAVAPSLARICREIANAELPMLEPTRALLKTGQKPTMDQIRAWRKGMEEARKKVTKLIEEI